MKSRVTKASKLWDTSWQLKFKTLSRVSIFALSFIYSYCICVLAREPRVLKDASFGRISFIGHSVGGLIIRKCLESELLKPLLCKLHLYISLASPHLGTLYADSQLVSTGNAILVIEKQI